MEKWVRYSQPTLPSPLSSVKIAGHVVFLHQLLYSRIDEDNPETRVAVRGTRVRHAARSPGFSGLVAETPRNCWASEFGRTKLGVNDLQDAPRPEWPQVRREPAGVAADPRCALGVGHQAWPIF